MNKLESKISLAIIGACCTRDAFNQNFIPSWREHFEVVLYKFQTSFISMFSCPIPFQREALPNRLKRSYFDNVFIDECIKDTLNQLVSTNPDVLLIDFYSDVFNGVVDVNGFSYLTDRSDKWSTIPAFNTLNVGPKFSISTDYDSYMTLWKLKFDAFMDFMKTYLPNTQIILNSVRCGNKVRLSDGTVCDYINPYVDIELLNKAWEEMDRYAITEHSIMAIQYSKTYYLDPDYIFGGKWIVHFHKEYHHDFFNMLLEMCKTTDVENVNEQISVLKDKNLLINASFQWGTLFWRHWDKAFKLHSMGDEKICVFHATSENSKKYSQLLSNEIEVKQGLEYTVSFKCKMNEPNLLSEDNNIFIIRSYEKRGLFTAKESVENISIKYDKNAEVDENGYASYSYSFLPTGKYVSIGPFVTHKGFVEWKNICFSHAGSCEFPKESVTERVLLDSEDCLIDVNQGYILNTKQFNKSYSL